MVFEEYWLTVMMVFTRLIIFFSILSFFRGSSIPMLAKTSFVLILAMFIANQIEPITAETGWEILGLVVIEILIGFLLGFVLEMMIAIVQIAGALLDIDIGLANPFYDGVTGTQVTILSKTFYYVFLLVFLVTEGFQKVLYGIVYTFQLSIRDDFLTRSGNVEFFTDLFQVMFFGALQIAIPFMMATFLVYIALLLMSKVVDKINILMNVFGIKIFVGLLMITMMIPGLMIIFEQVNEQMIETFYGYIEHLFVRR